MKNCLKAVFIGLVLFAIAPQVQSQTGKTPRLKDDIELPADFNIDFQLASAERNKVHASIPSSGTQYNLVGEEVFRSLVQNSTISAIFLPYQWRLSFDDSTDINAYSLPDGEVSVKGGLAQLIGSDRGLWAAVLSHEIAHVARRHAVKKYLYQVYVAQVTAYYESRARSGDNSANWALLGIRIAAPIAYAKMSRNFEHEADTQGMILMARAGYHPDSVFALHHLLRLRLGDASKFAAFFQDHPRWETRDQRSEKAYSDALAEYNRLWPDPALSSGGQPPVVAFAGNPASKENKESGTADLELPLFCRNANEPLTLLVHFSKNKHELQATTSEYGDSAGHLAYRQEISCRDKEDAVALNVHVPATLVSEKDRKATAEAVVLSPTGEVLERFKNFDVHFPKSDVKFSRRVSAPQMKTQTPVETQAVRMGGDQQASNHESHEKTESAMGVLGPGGGMNGVIAPTAELAESTKAAPAVMKLAESAPVPSAESQLELAGPSTPGWIGTTTKDDDTRGVVITRVLDDSAASRAGLQVGDVVVELNGTFVKSGMEFDVAIAHCKVGSQIRIGYIRGAAKSEAMLTVGRI